MSRGQTTPVAPHADADADAMPVRVLGPPPRFPRRDGITKIPKTNFAEGITIGEARQQQPDLKTTSKPLSYIYRDFELGPDDDPVVESVSSALRPSPQRNVAAPKLGGTIDAAISSQPPRRLPIKRSEKPPPPPFPEFSFPMSSTTSKAPRVSVYPHEQGRSKLCMHYSMSSFVGAYILPLLSKITKRLFYRPKYRKGNEVVVMRAGVSSTITQVEVDIPPALRRDVVDLKDRVNGELRILTVGAKNLQDLEKQLRTSGRELRRKLPHEAAGESGEAESFVFQGGENYDIGALVVAGEDFKKYQDLVDSGEDVVTYSLAQVVWASGGVRIPEIVLLVDPSNLILQKQKQDGMKLEISKFGTSVRGEDLWENEPFLRAVKDSIIPHRELMKVLRAGKVQASSEGDKKYWDEL